MIEQTFAAQIDRYNIVRNVIVIDKDNYDSGILDINWVWLGPVNVRIGDPLPDEFLP